MNIEFLDFTALDRAQRREHRLRRLHPTGWARLLRSLSFPPRSQALHWSDCHSEPSEEFTPRKLTGHAFWAPLRIIILGWRAYRLQDVRSAGGDLRRGVKPLLQNQFEETGSSARSHAPAR